MTTDPKNDSTPKVDETTESENVGSCDNTQEAQEPDAPDSTCSEDGEKVAEPDLEDGAEDQQSESDQADEEPTVESLMVLVEELRSAADSSRDQALRARAEAENVRKRSLRESQNARKFALESFAKELLPALDNFATAVAQAKKDGVADSVVQGIELSVKTLLDALERNGIQEFDPIGEVFDPEKHMAMATIEHADAEPGSIVEVFRKGYLIHDRLLREAEVIVAKAPQSEATEAEENEDD